MLTPRPADVSFHDRSGCRDYVVTAEIDGQKGASIRAVLAGATTFFDDFVVVVRQGPSTSVISADGTATRAVRSSINPRLVGPARVTIPGPPENFDLVILPSAVNVNGHLAIMPRRSLASSMRVTLSGPNLNVLGTMRAVTPISLACILPPPRDLALQITKKPRRKNSIGTSDKWPYV